MTTTRYYRNSTLYPTTLVIVVILIFSIVDNRDYKSEWLTSQLVIGMSFVTSLVYSLILSILCLPIFLVNIEIINRNKLLTALCWFLLPMIYITTVLTHEIKCNLTYNKKFGTDFVYVILLNLPFIVALIWTYLKYRQNNYRK